MARRLRGDLRILDANLNRAREAARVAEEHARFALDNAGAAARLKQLRHALRELAATLDARPGRLLAARDTPGDVGTALCTDAEADRTAPDDVPAAALKRLEEALRVIEEYAKRDFPDAACRVEALRYQAYAIESDLLGPARRLADARLCVIVTAALCRGRDVVDVARAAIRGGAEMIQLREKDDSDAARLDTAKRLRDATAELGSLFIVNDRADIAAAADADGVHLGQTDVPPADARRLLGGGALVGVSTHSLDQAHRAVAAGADYIGVGTIFATQTKAVETLAGPDLVRACAAEIALPQFAIGGLNAENVPAVVDAGAERIAVCSAVIGADDVEAAARQLRRLLPNGPKETE